MSAEKTVVSISIVGFLLLSAQGLSAGEAQEEEPLPRITPTRICPTTYLTIEQDGELESRMKARFGVPRLELAAIDKARTYFYLAGVRTFTTIPYYWRSLKIEIRADALFGVAFDAETGKPHLKPVFTDAGEYEFVFTDDLGFEPENSITITRTVTYLGPDHPDCPKYPIK